MNESTSTPAPEAGRTPGNLFSELYGELRALAHDRARRSGSPLNTTTLVHESFVRLAESGRLQIEDRQHFLAYACNVMRSIVVDFARANLAQKRGSGIAPLTLNTDIVNSSVASDAEVLRIHDALEELGAFDARLARVVEMRYFGGLSDAEIAAALDLTTRTVQRDWEKARMLLRSMLSQGA